MLVNNALKNIRIKLSIILSLSILLTLFSSCSIIIEKNDSNVKSGIGEISEPTIGEFTTDESNENKSEEDLLNPISEQKRELVYKEEIVQYDFFAPYATYSAIFDGTAKLYRLDKNNPNYKGKVITVNAGHGTKKGSLLKTFSHPDYTPKVSGGTNAEGSVLSSAISDGTTLNSGMSEAAANLLVANALKDKLLMDGYSVLMIREDDDCRLDNVARTVIANENSDAHIAIHFDSTDTDKGIFFMTPYNSETYLNMEPLKSNVNNIRKLGKCIIDAFKEMGEKVWKDRGTLQGDLTQISYSTIPSVDIELGDKKTELTDEKIDIFAEGIKNGINDFFGY